MNASPPMLNPGDTQSVLAAALHEAHGADAELEAWTAEPLLKRGKRRVVRYDLHARVSGVPQVQRYQWVGKFYERDDEARRVATVLRELAATGCGARGGFVVSSVLAYNAPRRLLLLTYESGESVTKAIARDGPRVVAAIGRALAVLHAAPVTPDGITDPAAVLREVRPRIADLSARFSAKAAALRHLLIRLERQPPAAPATSSFLHGDLGLAQLLWNAGSIVVLDFDDCTRGDPALDLGNLLTQLRRLTLRKPGKLPDFASVRKSILDAYQRWSSHDPGLTERVAWYEQIVLLRKIHDLEFDRTRHPEAEVIRQRQVEASRLLEELPALVETRRRASRSPLSQRS
jgi:aminoglycoside phosphotransferase (APT) family kinase protein